MRLAITAAALLSLTSAVHAAEPACQVIEKAMLAVSNQPGAKQTSTIKGGGKDRIEAILLPDEIYLNDGERWQRMPLKATQRKSMIQAALQQMPLSECTGPRSETLNGAAMNVYEYKQPDPMQPGSKTSAKLWIGATDGLMHRMEADTVTHTIEYGAFKPPI